MQKLPSQFHIRCLPTRLQCLPPPGTPNSLLSSAPPTPPLSNQKSTNRPTSPPLRNAPPSYSPLPFPTPHHFLLFFYQCVSFITPIAPHSRTRPPFTETIVLTTKQSWEKITGVVLLVQQAEKRMDGGCFRKERGNLACLGGPLGMKNKRLGGRGRVWGGMRGFFLI